MIEPKKLNKEEKKELIKTIRSYYTGENMFYRTPISKEIRELTERESEIMFNNILFAAFAGDIVETKKMVKEIKEMISDRRFREQGRRRRSRSRRLKAHSISSEKSWAELMLR